MPYGFNADKSKYQILNSKKVVLIGDSYLMGVSNGGTVENWGDKLNTKLQAANLGEVVASAAVGGKCFQNNGDGVTFLTMLQGLNVENKDEITDIVVGGGYNEPSAGSALDSAITAFINYAHTNYPNALVHIGMFGATFDYDGRAEKMDLLRYGVLNKYKRCVRDGAKWITNSNNVLHHIDLISIDLIHPNVTGQEEIARCVFASLTGGTYEQRYLLNYDGTTATTGDEINAGNVSANAQLELTDDTLTITVQYINLAKAYTNSGDSEFNIVNHYFTKMLRPGSKEIKLKVPATLYLSSKTFEIVPVTITVSNGNIKCAIEALNSAKNGWQNYTWTRMFRINATITIPLTLC